MWQFSLNYIMKVTPWTNMLLSAHRPWQGFFFFGLKCQKHSTVNLQCICIRNQTWKKIWSFTMRKKTREMTTCLFELDCFVLICSSQKRGKQYDVLIFNILPHLPSQHLKYQHSIQLTSTLPDVFGGLHELKTSFLSNEAKNWQSKNIGPVFLGGGSMIVRQVKNQSNQDGHHWDQLQEKLCVKAIT